MSESDDASRARPVDNSPIGVMERQLNRINGELDELNDKRIAALSDGTKNKAQLEALAELIKELKDEKEKKWAKLDELLTQATTARQKRTYGEVAQSPMTLPAAVQPSGAEPKRSATHFRYKSDSAVKHMRALLTKLAEHLVNKGLVPHSEWTSWSSTYGDVQAAYRRADSAAKAKFDELFRASTWAYLDRLNAWCNRQLHEDLPVVDGRVQLVCPVECFNNGAVLEIAKVIGLDADVLNY